MFAQELASLPDADPTANDAIPPQTVPVPPTVASPITWQQVQQAGIPGFEQRPIQQQMMHHVAHAVQNNQHLLIEAGTGAGKSFGYLVPLLLNAPRPIVISTGTIALQEQLLSNDIPRLSQALYGNSNTLNAKLVKGRANYLCINKLESVEQDLGPLKPNEATETQRLRMGINTLRTALYEGWEGDKATLDFPVDGGLWNEVASESEECLGWRCRFYDQNPYRMARESLEKADILIANHAIYCQDLLSGGGLLPPHEVVVFDEAHTLPNYAINAFSTRIGQHRASRLFARIQKRLMPIPDNLLWHLKDVEAQLLHWILQQAGTKREFRLHPSETFDTLAGNLQSMVIEVFTWVNELELSTLPSLENTEQLEKKKTEHLKLLEQLQALITAWELFLHHRQQPVEGTTKTPRVNWIECNAAKLHYTLISTPLTVGSYLQTGIWQEKTSILTSATLAVQNQLQFFKQTLGLDQPHTALPDWYPEDCTAPTTLPPCKEVILPTPFTHEKQCLYYIPTANDIPELTTDEGYWDALTQTMLTLLESSEGRAFGLFTSYQALHQVTQRLIPRTLLPIRVQGDLPRHRLIEWFKATPNSVLLATATFWEGIDVPGESLSLVMIDRLPFTNPEDPVHQATVEALKKTGKDWFRGYALPQAIIRLKQGVGRLIRTSTDTGVVALLDTRLRTKGYGKAIMASLPMAPQTSSIQAVQAFFEQHS